MATAQQTVPLTILIAPFPEGFQGNLDETFQQAFELTTAYIQGNFLTGLYLPPGSTLPTTDNGPIAMGGQWYFFDPTSGQYLPQSIPAKAGKNFAKNSVYQVQQTGSAFSLGSGITQTYDMALARTTGASVLSIAADTGPAASGDNDFISTSIRYTVGPTLVPTLAATDLYTHEHLIEGIDLAPLQGQPLSLSFSAWANVAGSYSAYLTSPGRDMSYVASISLPLASTWYRVKIANIPPLPTGTGTWHFGEGQTGLYIGVPMGVGSQWKTASLNSWQAGLYCGSAQNTNMLTVVNNQLKVTGIKLEAGSSPSYLAVPPFENDLTDCVRYYWTPFTYQSLVTGVRLLGRVPQDGTWIFNLPFPHRMCKAPTVVPYSVRATPVAGFLTDASLNVDIAVATFAAAPKGIDDTELAQIVTTGNIHLNTTTIDSIPSTTGMAVGMGVVAAGVPAGATIATVGAGTLTFAAGQIVTTGNTHTTTTIDGLPTVVGIAIGMSVIGAGIPAAATVATIASATSITISAAATATATGVALTFSAASSAATTGVALTVNRALKNDLVEAYITADARLS